MNYLETLYEFLDFQASLRELEEEKVWIRMIEKLTVALNAEAATYFLVTPKTRQLIAHYSVGVAPELLNKAPVDVGHGLCGWVAAHREPLLVENAYEDVRFLDTVDARTGFKTRSVLCVPLMDRLDLVGVAEFLNRLDGPFTKDDLRLVDAVCRVTAGHLRSLKLEAMVNKVTAHNANILENLSGGFLAVDVRGRVIICNPAAKRILGIEEEVVNQPVEEALKNFPPMAEVLMKTIASRQIVKRQEFSWRHQNQSRLVGYSTLLIQDSQGNFTGAGVTFQDLTAVRR